MVALCQFPVLPTLQQFWQISSVQLRTISLWQSTRLNLSSFKALRMGLVVLCGDSLSGSAVGERRTVTAGGSLRFQCRGLVLGLVLDQPTALSLRIPGNPTSDSSRISPACEALGSDIFGETSPVVDVELSLHGIAPAAGNWTMVSGLSGLTVALAENSTSIGTGSEPACAHHAAIKYAAPCLV
jgi:hypothetical protein